MRKNIWPKILWGAAIAASVVLLSAFGLQLYVKIAGMFGPVNPAAGKLSARLAAAIPGPDILSVAPANDEPPPDTRNLPKPEAVEEPQPEEKTPAEEITEMSAAAGISGPEPEAAINPPPAESEAGPQAVPEKSPRNFKKVLLYARMPKARQVLV
ncbi:MAG: hypothetical protein PHW69_09465, partial [Elusimicrobiaceae bacterium]|nr:hypothetical protein [Elusimicrobiaceae bacterium]